MIEQIRLEADRPDWAELLGKTTLVGGTAYAGYKTFKGLSGNTLGSNFFRKKMSGLLNSNMPVNEAVDRGIGLSYADILGETDANFYIRFNKIRPSGAASSLEMLENQLIRYGTGYKGQSKDLFAQVSGLYEDLVQRGYSPEISSRGMETGLGQIRLQVVRDGKKINFDVSAVSKEGTITLGGNLENRYAARGVLKDFNEISGQAIGSDVALVRKYRESLNEILTGETRSRDIMRTINERAIFEETKGKRDLAKMQSSTLQRIRRDQVVVDPFNELTSKGLQERMKRLMRIPGFGAGSASQFAKGILNLPESLLSRGLPGASESASAYQLLRLSEFENVKPSAIKWTEAQNFAQFKVATINDTEALKRVLKQKGHNIGEIAAEEILLNNTNNVGVKNRLYTYNIDLTKDPTKLSHRLLKRVAEQKGMSVENLAELMRGPGGITDIDIDINEGYKKLLRRKETLETDLDMLNRLKTTSVETAAKKYNKNYTLKSLQKVNEALRDYGVLGYAPDSDIVVKLKGAEELENRITQMRIREDKMSIALESHFKFGKGAKTFSGGGGGKWTVKELADVENILEQMEWQKASGITERLATMEELKQSEIRGMFKGVDILSTEAPVRTKKGTIAGREATAAIMSYATNLAEDTSIKEAEKLRRLKEIGIEQGKFVGSSLTGEQIISKIKGWHKDMPLDEIFTGTRFAAADVTNALLAADIHTVQSGFGGLGSISERAMYNMQALGLDAFSEDVMSRTATLQSPLAQLKELTEGQRAIQDATLKGRAVEQFADTNVLKAAFLSDLEKRKAYLGSERVTVGLGKNLAGIEKVNIYASETLAPYIGKQIGGEATELDRTTRDLIQSVASGESETAQVAAAKRYKKVAKTVQEGIESKLFSGKRRGSMYGQAVSALEGMDTAAKELGKSMGMEGMTAPLIAMSEKDIRRQMGKDALKRAVEGELWGMITREPVEGIHSTVPVNIQVAERFGAKNTEKGMIYLSGEDQANSMLRKSLFVDFDKDPLHVVAATTDKATSEIKDFMMNEKNVIGKQYKESLKRMSAFDLKSRAPRDISAIDEMMRVDVNTATKGMEKANIGIFSNQFKNIHIGLREQLGKEMTEAGAKRFMLGEDLSHLYIENILKAKHQSTESILRGEAQKVLDILQNKDFESIQKRTVALQSAFDEMVFGGEGRDIGEQIRKLSPGQEVSEELASRMGYQEDLASLAKSNMLEKNNILAKQSLMKKATAQAEAHRAISSFTNVENVLGAHDIGSEMQRTTSYAGLIGQSRAQSQSKIASMLDDVKRVASSITSKGLKNIGKYAILPTAAIGLTASLISKPRTLTPVETSAGRHEKEYDNETVSMPKTIYDIPDSKVSSLNIKGKISNESNTYNLNELENINGSNIRVSDHRAYRNKYTIDEMIEKGY